MNLLIKPIATTILSLFFSYSATTALAVPQKNSHSDTLVRTQTIDTLIIPGVRVGPVTHKTNKQNLVKLFGASHLHDQTISGAEGIGNFPATQVNLDRGRSLLIIWSDATRTKVASVKDLGSAWKTPEGIGIGTPLSELRKKLGNFKLYGLGWDYSGTILLETSRLSKYQGKLILQVDAAKNAYKNFPRDYQAVSGDSTFSSTNPHWEKLGIKVSQITVLFN